MKIEIMQIMYDEWFEKYRPLKNKIVSTDVNEEFRFETYGKELDYVKSVDNKYIWTQVITENEESWIIPGQHWVDRFGYYITEIAWEDENIEVNDNEMISLQEGINHSILFFKNIGFTFDTAEVTTFFTNTIDKEMISTGLAKYTAIDFYEDKMDSELTNIQQDAIHDYFSQIV